jgi:hypothetical protein
MTRGKPPAGYYTATVARRKLGNISDGKFRTILQEGKIRRYTPPGMKQGFYNREDVDRLAREFDGFLPPSSKEPGAQFQIATKEDMPELVNLIIEIFGGSNTTEKRLQWLERNPEIAFFVRSKGQMVGCVFVLPLTSEKIESILADPIPGSTRSLSADDIQPYVPGVPASLYVVTMGVKPGVSAVAKRARGQILIRGLIRFLIDLGHRGIPLQLITARTDSYDGIHLLRHSGFTEIESNTQSRNFIVEVERSGLYPMMEYKQALNSYRQMHKEE